MFSSFTFLSLGGKFSFGRIGCLLMLDSGVADSVGEDGEGRIKRLSTEHISSDSFRWGAGRVLVDSCSGPVMLPVSPSNASTSLEDEVTPECRSIESCLDSCWKSVFPE